MRRFMKRLLTATCVVFGLAPMTAKADIWTATNHWNSAYVAGFPEWVRTNFGKDAFHKPEDKALFGLALDCSDAIYAMRIIYAYQNSLPFEINDPRNGRILTNKFKKWDGFREKRRHENDDGTWKTYDGPEYTEVDKLRAFIEFIGDITSTDAPLVRLHSSCFTGDLLDSLRCDCGDQLHMALDMIGKEGCGVLVYLPQEGRGIGLVEKIKAYALQDDGLDTVEANLALGFKADSRDYGVGIQLLKDLGLKKVRLLTNNPKKTGAFIYGSFDLEVVGQIPIVPPIHKHNQKYLATKRDKMGHRLPSE